MKNKQKQRRSAIAPPAENILKARYKAEIIPELAAELGLGNPMAAPAPVKVVVSTSFYEKDHQDEAIKKAAVWMAMITGQKPLITKAKTSIAGFNLREGSELGLKVTLRGRRMWDFLEKLIAIVLPRVKDFQGVPRSGIDGHGNYTLGLAEQIIFPEVDYDSIHKVRGLQVSIVTNTADDRKALLLLVKLGLPFEKETER